MKAGLLVIALVLSGPWARAQETALPVCKGICDVCFSPQEGCDAKLIAYMDSAKDSLDIAIYSITFHDIAEAIKRAQARGVRIRIVTDYVSSFGPSSLVKDLKDAGIPLKIWRGENNLNGLMHHKFTIIDGKVLQTGSFNYTSNATKRNAENQIFVGDSKVVTKFGNEFDRLWNQLH